MQNVTTSPFYIIRAYTLPQAWDVLKYPRHACIQGFGTL